jgi:hypothetical protein
MWLSFRKNKKRMNKTEVMEQDESGFYVISAKPLKTASKKPKHLAKRRAGKSTRSKTAVSKNREEFLKNRQEKLQVRDEHVQKVVKEHRKKVKGESSAKSLRISEGIKVWIYVVLKLMLVC